MVIMSWMDAKTRNKRGYFDHRRRQHQCTKRANTTTDLAKEMTPGSFSNMASSWCNKKISSVISVFVCFLLVVSSKICPVSSSETGSRHATNQTFRPQEELQKLKIIREHLEKINKPASPVGDLIDCVLSHQQPAFDHPQLKGQKPLEPPERPKGLDPTGMATENFQLWGLSGEACPEGTHAVGYVTGEQYYGAKASINVWAPRVSSQYEFSLSQMWVISGSFGDDLNTIEAGWQVSPELYGDNYPRFFTYWTSDAYQATGCYNLLCSGFVQTNNRVAIGAAISPTSSYSGGQFDISLLVWKILFFPEQKSFLTPDPSALSFYTLSLDPKHGNWWLEFGNGVLVGYWPSFLFTHLRDHASMVQFGGEIVNTMPSGFHTSTQMGSGHFAGEGFGKASYFRNLQVVDWDNNLLPLSNLRVLADHPNCYDIQGGINRVWGNYFYYGGPGRNVRCP
ncbi:hypothetical protein DKX38_013363 [Salix brachista]|uniref:Neprosin PEP catalytic domain-containing protein n=1 Tax=Salix brachista TaxID=2182728 RepID=A0A5N5LSL9_9ROSI|nr:hypothetical protein DKX38_013363 [Salix brachista]